LLGSSRSWVESSVTIGYTVVVIPIVVGALSSSGHREVVRVESHAGTANSFTSENIFNSRTEAEDSEL
jgi:hypothetical protein